MSLLHSRPWLLLRVAAIDVVAHPWHSIGALISLALAVLVLVAAAATAAGFQRVHNANATNNVALLLSPSANSESTSSISQDDLSILKSLQVWGKPLGDLSSAERLAIVNGSRRGQIGRMNIALRGVVAEKRRGLALTQGRWYQPGTREVTVGASAHVAFGSLAVGDRLRIGGADFNVVGVFASDGSVFESEVWTGVENVANIQKNAAAAQSVRVMLPDQVALEALRTAVEKEPRIRLKVWNERDFYQQQAQGMVRQIYLFGLPVALLIGLGAATAASGMFLDATVRRKKQHALLHAIGMPASTLVGAQLVECFVLALLACAASALVALVVFADGTANVLGQAFTQVAFKYDINGSVLAQGVSFGIVLVLLAALPALRMLRLISGQQTKF
jgi:putative ABC transport system permease protein